MVQDKRLRGHQTTELHRGKQALSWKLMDANDYHDYYDGTDRHTDRWTDMMNGFDMERLIAFDTTVFVYRNE